MGTMHPQELLRQWPLEKMPVEMTTGHILQNLVLIQTAIDAINITLYNLRADVDSLIAHTGMQPNSKGKKKGGSPEQSSLSISKDLPSLAHSVGHFMLLSSRYFVNYKSASSNSTLFTVIAATMIMPITNTTIAPNNPITLSAA